MRLNHVAAALVVSVAVCGSAPAHAVGVVTITQSKVNAGGVTPGDSPGFPVTISEGGSYRLDSNLDLPPSAAGQDGIEIRAFAVTIDFNGFQLHGRNRGFDGISGIFNGATIKNGVIIDFNGSGVNGVDLWFWTIDGMKILANGGRGVHLGAMGSVRGSLVSRNAAFGVQCTTSCHIEENIISDNAGVGVNLVSGTILGNTIVENESFGFARGASGPGIVGYGNNTLFGNNGGARQIGGTGLRPLEPNACQPAC